MTFTITMGWWILPAVITLVSFMAAICFAVFTRSEGDFNAFDVIFGGGALMVATIVSLISWMSWMIL